MESLLERQKLQQQVFETIRQSWLKIPKVEAAVVTAPTCKPFEMHSDGERRRRRRRRTELHNKRNHETCSLLPEADKPVERTSVS